MHASRMSTDITRKSFWTQRLQAAESGPTTPVFFDQGSASQTQVSGNMADAYDRTALAMTVNSADLQVAACMHHLSADTIILAAWAVLLRSYAGEDGPVNFGACLDREQAAWLFAMAVTGDELLLSAMRAAEQEKKLVIDHSLTFESLSAFAEGTGYGDIATAVYIHSGKQTSPEMHLPSLATLVVNVADGAMVQVHLNFRNDALSPDRAQSVVDNFGHILCTMTKRMQSGNKFEVGEMMIKDVETVSRRDYRRIVDFSAPLPPMLDACVHEMILSRCADATSSQRVAVAAWDGSFTYAELAKHAMQLAGAIAGAAQHRDQRDTGGQLFVPFCLTKSKWTPVAIIAILAAGGACVPLEPSHPPARRNEILAQTNARIVLTNSNLFQGLTESFADDTPVRHVLCVDEDDAYNSSTRPDFLPPVHPDDLCYVIFTSGSSGTPKGVKWPHNALATSIWEHGRAFHMDAQTRVLQFASHVFDVSVSELVTPLVHGGCVVIPSDTDRVDPDSMARFMQRMDVNCALLVASYARLLSPAAVPSLRTLILGGESIGQDNIDKWTPALDRLIIGYGSAETCINCAKNELSVLTRSEKPWKEGLGLAVGARMLIADRSDSDRLVPVGAVGEIIVEGPILAQGYLNDDAKTARAYIENPAWVRRTNFRPAHPRRRFYRTGDLGRQATDGSITFIGRADFQVKVRGQRMELGEVRAAIVGCLSEAVDIHVDVICPEGEKVLAAFLSFGQKSAGAGGAINIHTPDHSLADSLRSMVAALRQSLPPAAVPSFFVPMAGFPYLVSGKVDRRALLGFANQASVEELASYNSTFMAAAGESAAPGSAMEEALVTCCREVLKLPSLGINDNFFASGGDSIAAIKVVSSARAKGVDVTVANIFSSPTIRELAEVATVSDESHSFEEIETPEAFSLLPSDLVREIMSDVEVQGQYGDSVLDIYPCAPLQEALVALSSRRSGAYIAQHVLELPDHVDVGRFKASWAAVVQRHDILRTRILESPHGAVQAVYDSEIEWHGGSDPAAYCEMDRAIPMGFGDNLVRFGLVNRTFIFTIHHSLFDGWSITRLFEDVERQYAGQSLLDLKPYNLFIRYLSGLDVEKPEQFWLSRLASDTGLASCHFPQSLSSSYTPIPDSEARSTISTAQYGKSEFTMPTRIRAAWAMLVGRYLDSQDVIFGETLSGRTSMDNVEAIAGPTISTVPIRVKWDATRSVASLLQEIQSEVIEITNSGHLGVQNISRLSSEAHEACQFQHIIVIQPKKSSLRSSPSENERSHHKIGLEDVSLDLRSFHSYALNMDFMLEDDGVTVTTTFDSHIFTKREIEHLQAQFTHILDQICRTMDVTQGKLSDIDYTSPMDKELQIEHNQRQHLEYDPTTLLRALGRHATEQPDAPAINAWDGVMTYRELDRTSSALATHLSSFGLRKGDYIPHCFPKTMWTTVAIMATLKIGAISVALEPSHPDSSISKVLSQIRPKLVLCARDYCPRIQTLGQGSLAVDGESVRDFVRSGAGATRRRHDVRPDDTAFVVFTSGSTGEPKGIPLDHGAVCIMAQKHGEVMNIRKDSRILQFAAHVFDVSIGDLAIALFHGACLCVPSDDDRMNDLAQAINSLAANRAWLTPTVAALISPAECPSMEWLSVGGEQLTQTCKDIWAGVPLVNVYGPAEVTNVGTAVQVTDDLPITNIGRANGTRVWICEQGNPHKLAPAGCIGEIVFEGPNLSRGYLGNPKLTAAAFPEVRPWLRRAGQGGKVQMYCTGDLARLNVDGSIDFKGRKDTQIKLRGQRIEITAVEGALQAAIDEPAELAVDILAGDGGRDSFLVAFLHLPERLADATNEATGIFSSVDLKSLAVDIRSRVSLVLPAHMIPTMFIPLNRLPKLVSGKIDRKTLRLAAKTLTDEQLSSFKLDQTTEKRHPTTETEAAMQKMWATVLRLDESDVGIDDNFVSLGGDSISAIKLVAHARSHGLHITVSSIFEHATIANLCASSTGTSAVAASTQAAPAATVSLDNMKPSEIADIALQCGISEAQIEDVYPCTALQEGMLMLTEKKPTAYIAHHVMDLPSWVDVSTFRSAWEIINNENAILRTRVVPAGLQVVQRPTPLHWTKTSSRDLSAYFQETRRTPMGFGTSLTRQAILDNPKRFVWTAHHSVYDGWTMPLLAKAITHTYMTLTKPGVPLEPQKDSTLSFRAFVDWVSRVDKDRTKAFWRNQLDGADAAPFPPSMPSSYEPLADAMVEMKIPFLRDGKSTTTTSSIIRAAWAILISAYSGSHPDIVFGSAVTGRSAPLDGLLTLIGPTLATIPIRVVLDPRQRIRDLLAGVQQQSFAMLEFEQYGLQNIRKSAPAAASACDFQSLLVVHTEAEPAPSTAGFSWSEEREESEFLTNALTLECQPMGSKLGLTASYDSSLMDERQMRRMLSTFEHILGQLCSDQGKLRVEDIDTVSPSDRAEIANITKDLPPRANDRVHDMFARQAAATPDAMAITASDGDFTYRQLDRLSTKLSYRLRALGLGPECFAPFLFEKSKWVPVALLAILKAGGACVPLDPAQPLDRLQHIIGTLDARIVLTSSTHAHLLDGVDGVKHFVEVSQLALDSLPTTGGRVVKSQPSPSSACYAIFTSGSTGTPKGVVWDHATLCSSMVEHGAAFNYSTTTRVLQFASHTFDVSVSELLTTFMFGGCLCIPDDFTRLNGISDFMNEKKVNWTFFAPSFARLMDPATVPGLKTIVLGGEAPGKDNIERWSGRPGLELIVTYGPAESCIYCAKNSVSGPQIDGSIGNSIGGMMWIADLGRPDRLAPIGAVGEIAVEGSILARGYLKDAAKTAASFRAMPTEWANGRSSRVYYTGDLGRVNTDGTISCLGRRDDQVKIRGQRVELADIEYHLRKDERVRQALVLYPRAGPCADLLVGVLSMSNQDEVNGSSASRPASSADIDIAPAEEWASTVDVQDRLMEKVPTYMVPSMWIVLDSIPLMPASQKVNRKMVSEWTKGMDQLTYEHIAGLSAGQAAEAAGAPTNALEEQVRNLWSAVLNVSPDIIGPNTSFLRVGGDSISAMQIIARCRSEGIHVTVQDLLKARTLADFCDRARASTAPKDTIDPALEAEDETETPFALSPIQSWFMNLTPEGENYFNQSNLLRFTEDVKFNDLQDALLAIVQRHSMLRARFQAVAGGTWQQYVSTDAEESLQCRVFQSVPMKKAASYALNAQASLDIVNGPLMAADMYKMTDGTSALFITCHHLAVDLVSWRIILQELEELLRTGKFVNDRKPLSFRTWSRLLSEHSESLVAENDALTDIHASDFEFWGISSDDNVAATITEKSFVLDEQATQLLLGQSNETFNTEPLDILITAVAHSFNQVFRGVRNPVTIFNEVHGREPWRSDLDLSSTVGWFTSMCPILLSDHREDALRSLREVKDFRRAVPEKGLPFFSSFAPNASSGVEVTFNYFGLYQQLERDGALFNWMNWESVTQPSDASPDVPRFSLFDVSAGIENGVTTINFAFCEKIQRQDLVQQWISACSETLNQLIHATSQQTEPTLTLSDLPNLPATYDELSTMLTNTLPSAGVSASNIQDIYPCSPMQTALLVSQAVDPSLYSVRYVWEAVPKSSGQASLEHMLQSWKQVVKQHPMLRTIFVQGVSSGKGKTATVYNQVVLKEFTPGVTVCEDTSSFPVGRPEDHIQGGAPHHLVLCQPDSGKLLVQLDISHSLIDGTSVNILLDSLIRAYDGTLTPAGLAQQDCYANYVTYLRRQDLDASQSFWNQYLEGADPCQFPSLRTLAQSDDNSPASGKLEYLDFNYPNPARLHAACSTAETTAASIYKLAWALLLRAYTGSSTPCFGFLASGRDLPIEGIEDSVGPFINMLVCKISLEEDDAMVESVLRTAHSDYANCLSHQVCSLAEILRGLQLGGARLFNTIMSVQRHMPPGTSTSKVDFQPVHVEDPSEFDIVLNIGDSADFVDVSLTYNTSLLSGLQAKRLAGAFTQAIDGVLDSLTKSLSSIDLLPADDYEQMVDWNCATDSEAVSALCDKLIGANLATRANKPAVSGWDLSMTHSELDELTTALAEHLVSNYSLSPNTLIPFCYEKSAWAIVVMVGIMKAGAAFVPLDPKHPVDRLAQIVQRLHTPLVICSEKNAHMSQSLAGDSGLSHLVVGPTSMAMMKKRTAMTGARRVKADSFLRGRNPSDLAYCLFTSGSTGMPKGVLMQHQGLCSSATMHGRAFGYTSQSRSVQFASYAFDACIAEIFTTLIMGGCVCVPSDAQKMDPEQLTRFIEKEKTNIAFFTPSFLALMTPEKIPSLTTLLIGGEAVGSQLVERWMAPYRRVAIAYGPTECCVYCTGYDCTEKNGTPAGKNMIGTSVGSVSWVADARDHNKLAPIGAIGELLVEGPILAKGYLDDEDKTNDAFVRPAWMRGNRVAYRTGDLVRYHEDGNIEYLGRRDNQVKVRGQRLELGEIEQQLVGHPEVQQCVVFLPKEGLCRQKIVAVMTLASGSDKTTRVAGTIPLTAGGSDGLQVITGKSVSSRLSAICEATTEALPPYMVPTCWVVTDRLPLLPSGKADRRFISSCIVNMGQEMHQLAVDMVSAEADSNAAASTEEQVSPVAKALREVWSTVLNVDEKRINPASGSFIRMGGDSISAMEVVALCRAKGIPLLIENLLKATSISMLASSIEQANPSLNSGATIGGDAADRGNPDDDEGEERIVLFGLSPIQRMFTKVSPVENHFNQSFLLKVSTSKARVLEADARKALNVIVRRHAMLRARFQKLGRTFKQWIEPSIEDSYTFQSWDITPSTPFPAEAAERIAETQKTLDLSDGPVFAGDLFNCGDEQYIFLTAHHLVVDLVSWRIILKDLEDYLSQGSISAYRSLSFEKWCGLLNTHRKALLEAPGNTHLPFEPPKPDYEFWGMAGKPNYATDFEHHQFTLSAGASQALLGGCNDAFGTEALDLFISAVMHSFAATFKGREIPPLYNEGHGREPWEDSLDLSRTVGWFTTIAPVWVSGRDCGDDILQYVKQIKDVRRKIPSKGFSHFTSLDLDRKPFNIEVSFNYFGSFQQLDRSDALLNQVHWRNIGVDPCEVSDEHKKFSLIDIAAENENDRLVFTFSYNSKIQHQQDVQRWIKSCKASLENISRTLGSRESEHTITDFDHLPEDYDLQVLRDTTFKDLDIVESNVADIYPCSPAQQGMLLTQSKDPNMYWFRSVYEVQSGTNAPVTADMLRQGWKATVQRHPVLRTVFIEQNSTDGLYDQLVLRECEPDVVEIDLATRLADDDLLEQLKIESVPEEVQAFRKPQHQLRIVRHTPTGRIFCSFLISHAIIDGSSMGILLRDFGLACEAKLVDTEPLLYKNYITYLKSRDNAADVGYWKESLEGIDPCFLPSDAAAGLPRAMSRAEVPRDQSVYAKMMGVARELGVSPFTLLQVTWALTLREYVNPDRDDCCFGVVTSGRDLPVAGIQDIAGPFVNILTSKVALPHDAPVSRIAETVHNGFIDNLAHQTSSLAEVMHELGSGALFNTGMTLQKIVAGAGSQDSGLSFHALGGVDPTEFDVVVHAIDDGQAMHVHLSYWSDKVSTTRANEMARSFSSVLWQILQRPEMLPVELHMASDKDLQQLWSWNATLPPASEKRIEEMIAEQVMVNPDREALWSTEETLSYKQLDLLSTALARSHLADVAPEEIVPLCFDKSVWVAVAMVAVLKAGATVVLMDPSHPVERLKSIVGTVKADLVLASPSHADMCMNSLGIRTVPVSREVFNRRSSMPGTSARSMMARQKAKSPADAAYIVFTSGSTGTPKGSVTEHRSFCTATKGYHQAIGQLPGTRVLQFASYSFDASVLEILGSLMVGATVCIPTDKERSNQLTAFINKSKVSFAVITPTVASLFEPEDVPTLSCLALCGEPMTASHISKWASKVRLVNAFGPSECCVGSAANQQLDQQSSPKCIGWAVACCYWVVHPRNHNRLARVGSVGELLIEGSILARHYLNEEAKTKEAFIDAPEWARPGRATRLYKTGDLVYQNADGSFQYVGRKDTQAKIRGQRLEFGDIEQAFKEVVPQSDSVVAEIVQPEGRPSQLLVFFSGKNLDADNIDAAEIQSKMAQKIPAYMVPSAVIPLPQMPLMPSGKVDRKKIRTLGAARPTRREKRSGRAPETEMEIAMAALWKDVMKGDKQILADDSFFQVGGDSYTAMKLVTEARARGIALNVSIVMQAPKLSDMAYKATRATSDGAQATLASQTTPAFSMVSWTPTVEAEVSKQCGVPTDKIEDVYPCTPLQEGLFVLSVKQPGSYIARHCYRLSPELDLGRYQNAWNTVFASSAILRTHIVQLDNAGGLAGRKSGLYQAVIQKPLVWQHQAGALDKYLSAQPMPALGGPLVKFTIVEETSNSRYLVLTMHHAAYDGASVGMLLNSVEAVYTGTPRPASVPFREFIKYLEGSKGEPTRNFWSQYLDGASASTFPAVPLGYVPSADSTFEHDLSVPAPQSKAHTMSTMIRVAWAIVMARHAGGDTSDMVFGETLSGRNDSRDGVADVDGPLITTVPVRCVLDPGANVEDVLSAMQSAVVDMIPFQQAGLQNIRFMSADAAEACNFSCLVTIAPASEALAKPALGVTPIEGPPSPAMDYPMSMQFILQGQNGLKVSVCHDNKLVDGVQMRRIVDQFGRVLGQLCSGEKKTVGDIEVQVGSGTVEVAALEPDVLGVLGGGIVDIPEEISTQELSKAEPAAGVVRAAADLQPAMRNLWADILRVDAEEVLPEDNFFRLGGDSISAMRLVTAAEHKQIKVTVADIFHHPTLEALCEFAAQANAVVTETTTTSSEMVVKEYAPFAVLDTLCLDQEEVVDAVCKQLSVFPGDVEDVYPATDYQAWAVSHGLMRSRGNTNYFLFRLHGNLDTFRLEQACRKMVGSNPILRTLFTTIGSQVMQVVLRSYQIEFQRYGREHRVDDGFIRWLVEQDTQRSTYLSQSIVRFKLLKHTEGHYVLVMRVSHAQYDGMSLPLLYQDLEKCYGGGEPIVRPSFGSFIQGATVRQEEAVDYWSQLLDGSSMTEVVQHPGPAYKHNVDTIRTRSIPPIPVNVAGMSQATLVKAAWALVLAKMSGQRDIVFGNLIFGRNIPVSGIEDVSGPCINMIPIRIRLNEMDSIHNLLALVQEQQLASMPHESLGFRQLIRDCTDWPTWMRFSSVVQHQNLGRDGAQEFPMGEDLKCEMGVLGPAYDSSDLWVQTTPRADSFNVEIGSCSAVVSPDIAETLLDRLCAVLSVFASVGSGPDRQLWELLALDHAPLIPIKSSVVDQVWNRVLPDASAIPWDTPYYEMWGDEIAPVRFLEEYAEHGILLDMEDILEHPTKQAQMMLTAGVMAERGHSGVASKTRRNSGDSAAVSKAAGGGGGNGSAAGAGAGATGPAGGGSRSFWVLDSKAAPSSQGGHSRGSSAMSSPRFGSPRFGPTFPGRGKGPGGRGLRKSPSAQLAGSRSGSVWDLPSVASWSENNTSTVSLSSPSLSSSSSSAAGPRR